jgi:small-conductance mechanosensitive channel
VTRFWDRINPTVRGFLILVLIALAVVVLNLYTALVTASILLQVAFFLAVAFFVFLLWRERREEIGAWPARSRAVFYGGALLIVADVGAFFYGGVPGGLGALAFLGTLVLSGFAMWRVWRDERTYSI